MQGVSVFTAECICGRTFETPSREYICPACNRHIRLEWGRDPEAERRTDDDVAARSVKEAVA